MDTADIDIPQLMYAWAKSMPPKVINRISPSQLGGCMRAHYYAIQHLPHTTEKNPGAILNMQTGFMWEDIIVKALDQAKVPYKYQLYLEDEQLNLAGTLDFGLIDNTGKEMHIWDSKTESSLAKKFRGKAGYVAAHADYEHQLNCYAIMARRKGWVVKRGGFVVIRRDDSLIEKHPFIFNELSIAQTLERIATLNRYLTNKQVPPCDGKFCQIGLCDYGNPHTRRQNAKGKIVNTECCPPNEQILIDWSK